MLMGMLFRNSDLEIRFSLNMNVLIDGRNPADPTSTVPYSMEVGFTASGQLDTSSLVSSPSFTVDANGRFTLNDWVPAASDGGTPPVWSGNGADANATGILVDLRSSTQFSSSFAVNSVSQDGYTTGQLAGLEIDDTGVIFARYTNGQSKAIARVQLADFKNLNGLQPIGGNEWKATSASGEPLPLAQLRPLLDAVERHLAGPAEHREHGALGAVGHGGDAAVIALNDMSINATVDGGAKSSSAAIGTSLAFNSIGWAPGSSAGSR